MQVNPPPPTRGERSAEKRETLAIGPLGGSARTARHACEARPSPLRSEEGASRRSAGGDFSSRVRASRFTSRRSWGSFSAQVRHLNAPSDPGRLRRPVQRAPRRGVVMPPVGSQDLPSAGLRAPPAGAAPAKTGCPVSARKGECLFSGTHPLRRSACGIVSGDAPSMSEVIEYKHIIGTRSICIGRKS